MQNNRSGALKREQANISMLQAQDFNHCFGLYSHSGAAPALFIRTNTPLLSRRKASAAGTIGTDPPSGTRNA
jgi:hypothetical protein